MGEARQARGLSDAAGRPAADRLAARSALSRFWRDERGATAIEYGMIVALIAVALIGILGALSGTIKTTFTKVNTLLATSNAAK
ncbi:Flp family type IVb pilin [Caulobacter sp. DWR2-3-1b2]|uniref:Flp family type IVb pilin n=1 Tax=unclassified Caulobacter TaxID=2648921 RepID=UPI0019A01EA3|nr:Flp family type IVb pilin [Caulobacter sp.]